MDNVIDFAAHKASKQIEEELARGRTPLFISHLDGSLIGTSKPAETDDFGNRLSKIKASLEKLNRVMQGLKTTDTKKE